MKKDEKIMPLNTQGDRLTFISLVEAIRAADYLITEQTTKAINIGLTLRNWFFGHYIHVYELKGTDRASYGAKLYQSLAERLQPLGISRTDERELRRYVKFYTSYPQIREALTPEFLPPLLANNLTMIRESVTPELQPCELSPQAPELLTKISFTMFGELLQIENPLKRAFYEREVIRNSWSVRELKRQIASLLFERTGLSEDKRAVVARTGQKFEKMTPAMTIRDPYIFEFLGLKPYEALNEHELESELLEKFQEFLLELGHGFCFEGRRKRILIGDEYYFVDLVFYHRILKCHVLIELKVDEFSHQHLGQLNTYVTWYKKNMMTEGDSPPIGILLCTKKSTAKDSVVEYALAGMDNQLFVSRYELELPRKEDMLRFLEENK
ncbi:MAG: Putative nuclease YhcG [Desulfovibrio sp.]